MNQKFERVEKKFALKEIDMKNLNAFILYVPNNRNVLFFAILTI